MRLEPDGTWEFELDLSVDDSSEIETYDLEVVEILEAAPDEILDDQEAGENVEMYDGLQTTDHDISHGQMEFRLQAGVESVTRSGLVLEGDETIEAYPDILDDHDDVLEPVGGDDAFQGVASIEGTVENTHDSQINEIEVRARVYNEAGERIHQGTVSTASLGTGASWDFELTIEDDLRAVASYDIAVLTAEN